MESDASPFRREPLPPTVDRDPSRSWSDVIRGLVLEAERVLQKTAKTIAGAKVLPAGSARLEPDFFITGLRVPSLPKLQINAPARVYFLVMPTFNATTVGSPTLTGAKAVFVAAMGSATEVLSLRKFLRAWNATGLGGKVVYEGIAEQDRFRQAYEESIVGFLNHMGHAAERRAQAPRPGEIKIWPISADFRLTLCDACLLPAGPNRRCIKCRKALIGR